MLEAHRVRNGLNEWRNLPAGYRPLKPEEKIQSGDVQKLNNEWYCEYGQGLLIGSHQNRDWFRKVEAQDRIACGPMKSDRQIVDGANDLARKLYRLRGYEVPEGWRFDLATHPHEVEAWNGAVLSYDHVNGTDVLNALAECEDE